jgi:3-dehydroquinate dehydratase/shikimate dehydrogenase
MAQVVETLLVNSMVELRRRLEAPSRADMQEIRLDAVRDADVAGALAARRRPVIVTCRARWEGGLFDGSEEERLKLLVQAAEAGAEFVDVEWRAPREAIERCRRATRIVVSHHDFSEVPADVRGRVDAMRRVGGTVTKIAVTPQSLRECLAFKNAIAAVDATDIVAIAMGPAGRITRVWPAWIGSRWTYAGTAAPGQIGVDESIDVYRVRESTPASAVFAVAGCPLGHSASPAMHNAAFAALKMDAVYVPLETASADDLMAMADGIGLRGASVTIPLKRALASADVSRDDDLVDRIGALNTLRRTPEGWASRNFDVAGFLAPLVRRGVPLAGTRALVLGAGGAARAAIFGLASKGAIVAVAARRREAAAQLAADLGVVAAGWPPESDWDLLVNTTPVGMWPDVAESPAGAASFGDAVNGAKTVYDLVYNPAETELLRRARAAGATAIGGLDMLISQACHQFEWWTERQAPRDVMESAAKRFLEAPRV